MKKRKSCSWEKRFELPKHLSTNDDVQLPTYSLSSRSAFWDILLVTGAVAVALLGAPVVQSLGCYLDSVPCLRLADSCFFLCRKCKGHVVLSAVCLY